MSSRSRSGPPLWLLRAATLLRVAIVAFVAVLASGVVHAHEQCEDVSCEDDGTHEDGGEPGCPDDLCGPAHHCGCCSPLVVTCSTSTKVVAAAAKAIVRPTAASMHARSGVRSRVERPPQA